VSPGKIDGSARPFLTGIALCAAAGLALVLWTERGRLFAARDAVPVPA